MILVESLRLRRWSIGWASVILVIAIGVTAAIRHAITTVEVNGSQWSALNVPLVTFAPLALFLSMIYTSSAGLSLNSEGQTLALSWTKPLSRAAIALRIVAVDIVAVIASSVFAWLVIFGVIAGARGSFATAPDDGWTILLGIGASVMWYALVMLITAGLPAGNSSGWAFVLWPVALFSSGLRFDFGAPLNAIVLAINTINPLAYMSLSVSHGVSLSYWQAPTEVRAAIVWLLAAVLIGAGVAIWTRREA